MKNITLLTLTLVAAATASAQSSLGKPGLSYDRVGVSYFTGDDVKGYDISASALLGDHFIVSGGYRDADFKNLDAVSGNSTGFGLGYRIGAGPGDVILSIGYAQVQAAGVDSGAAVFASGESLSFGIAYRQLINDALEFGVSYSRSRQEIGAGGVDLYTGQVGFAGSTENVNEFGGFLRYHATKSFDLTLGYDYSDNSDVWSLAATYKF
jgi:hypothetical protein